MRAYITALACALAMAPAAAHAAGKELLTAERFHKADADGNGMLSRAEAEMAAPRLAKQFDAIDVNRDGQMSPEEIRAHRRAGRNKGAAGRSAGTARPGAKFAAFFARADTDGDGALSRAEAERGMPRIAGKFARIDRDGDGRLTLEELQAWFALRRSARAG